MIFVTKTRETDEGFEVFYEDLPFTYWGLVHELKAYDEPWPCDDPTVFEAFGDDGRYTLRLSAKNTPAAFSRWLTAFKKSRGVRKAWLPIRCDLGI